MTIWESRNCLRGTKSQVAVLLTIPKAVPANAKGMQAGLFFFSVFSSFKGVQRKRLYSLLQKYPKTQRPRTLNPSEVYIKILPKKNLLRPIFPNKFQVYTVRRAFNQI